MKLYTKPGACSTADHIALQWTGQPFEFQVLTAAEMKAPAYLAINPAGSVPALVDGDFVLTQNAATWATSPMPPAGAVGRRRQRAPACRSDALAGLRQFGPAPGVLAAVFAGRVHRRRKPA
jgi:glutathione S-transferase